MTLWKQGSVDKEVFAFTVGNDHNVDYVLLPYDILGSKAHAKMLAAIEVLTKNESEQLVNTLGELQQEYDKGNVTLRVEDEDMHTYIEQYLVKKLGDIGKKIHTGRSRNDQVLTALRLYQKDMLQKISTALTQLIQAYGHLVKDTTPMPGYTHMQKAMPSSVGLWAEAYVESLQDTLHLLEYVTKHVDQSPLGTAAGFGAPLPVDRVMTAKELQFAKVQHNPIYCQNSRGKFEAIVVAALQQVMFDVNKAATDLMLFSMSEFGFFSLPKEICTGSSIMPQKQNPDVLELLRAKYHVVIGEEMKIKSLSADLISGFNRDVQLTKEPVMHALTTTLECVNILTLVIGKLSVNVDACKKAMTPELYATEKAYELVKKGMSFRDAYHEVKKGL